MLYLLAQASKLSSYSHLYLSFSLSLSLSLSLSFSLVCTPGPGAKTTPPPVQPSPDSHITEGESVIDDQYTVLSGLHTV